MRIDLYASENASPYVLGRADERRIIVIMKDKWPVDAITRPECYYLAMFTSRAAATVLI